MKDGIKDGMNEGMSELARLEEGMNGEWMVGVLSYPTFVFEIISHTGPTIEEENSKGKKTLGRKRNQPN